VVLSRSCRRISTATHPRVSSRGHPVSAPYFPPPPPPPLPPSSAISGHAMHYAPPRVSWKVLSEFSLAFCTYPRWFAARDDCSDKTRVCTYVHVSIRFRGIISFAYSRHFCRNSRWLTGSAPVKREISYRNILPRCDKAIPFVCIAFHPLEYRSPSISRRCTVSLSLSLDSCLAFRYR